MDFITQLLGRFHPVLVHLPIGILLLAFIFECLALNKKHRHLRKTVQPALLWGAIFAIAASVTGYFLNQEGGYDDDLVTRHQYLGIATAIFTILLYFFRRKIKSFYTDSFKRQRARVLLFFPLIVLVSLTGHYGGSLTHGEDYLFVWNDDQNENVDFINSIKKITNPSQAVLYKDVVQPVLQAKCYACHSSRKQKGDLRLDGEEFIVKGGKEGEVLIPGLADSSSLYNRLLLPVEDKHHMPPEAKTQMTSSEIDLLNLWIKGGAGFDKPVSEYPESGKLVQLIQNFQYASEQDWIPDQEVNEANANAVNNLKASGALVMPVGEATNYLMVNFVNARTIDKKQLESLKDIKDQLLWLNLGYCNITDGQLEIIAQLTNLKILYLNNTAVTDTGIANLSALKMLTYLNLVNTAVTDSGLKDLEKLKNLKRLFLFQTQVTSAGVKNLRDQLKAVQVDTGTYILKKLASDTIVYKRKI